jgi:hypothetical protein
MIFLSPSYYRLWLPLRYLSQFPTKPSFSHVMPHLAYRALIFDNLQSTTHFVELLIKHPDLPLPVKWFPAYKLTQKVLPLFAMLRDMMYP